MKMTSTAIFVLTFLIFAITLIACAKSSNEESLLKEDPVKKIFEAVKANVPIMEKTFKTVFNKKVTEGKLTPITKKQDIISENVGKIEIILNKFKQKNEIKDKHFLELSSKFWLHEGQMEKLAEIIAKPEKLKEIHENLFFWQSISVIVGVKAAPTLDILHFTKHYNNYLKCIDGIKTKVKEKKMDLEAVINHFLEPVAKVVKFISEIRTVNGKLLFKKDFVDYATEKRLAIIPEIDAKKMDPIIDLLFKANPLYPASPVKNDRFEEMLRALLVNAYIRADKIKNQVKRNYIVNDLIMESIHYAQIESVEKIMMSDHPDKEPNFEIWNSLNYFLSNFGTSDFELELFGRNYHDYVNALTKVLDQMEKQKEEIDFDDMFKVFLGPVLNEIKLIKQIEKSVELKLKDRPVWVTGRVLAEVGKRLQDEAKFYYEFETKVKEQLNWKNLISENSLNKIIYVLSGIKKAIQNADGTYSH